MRRALFAVLMTVFVATPALAASFGPEYCARTYSASRDAFHGGGWKVLGVYFPDGHTRVQKMSGREWTKCDCPKDSAASCVCCEYDAHKVCAEQERLNSTTNARFRLGPCGEVDR